MKKLRNFVVGFALAILSISASAIPSAGDYEFTGSGLSGTFTVGDGGFGFLKLTAWDIKDDLGGMYSSPGAAGEVLFNDEYSWSAAYVTGERLHQLNIWWALSGVCAPVAAPCASWVLQPNYPNTEGTLGTGVVSLEFLAVTVPVPGVTLLLVLGVAVMAVAGRVKFRAVSI